MPDTEPDNEDPADELGDEGSSLVVEDLQFAIVPEWVIAADVSDGAFRVYSLLLRHGNTSGCRMPSRALARAPTAPLRRLDRPRPARARHRGDGARSAPPLRTAVPFEPLPPPHVVAVGARRGLRGWPQICGYPCRR